MKRIIFLLLLCVSCVAKNRSFENDKSELYELQSIQINGTSQWISIRTKDRSKPVLLFLHGGPGFSEMALVRHYNAELEKDFIVVSYDQRGAGKSWKAGSESVSIEDYVADCKLVIDYCRKRFGKQRVFLVGHSWGSFLGLHVIDRYPENIHAYFGTGQLSNVPVAEKISYQEALKRAQEQGHVKALDELAQIGEPLNGLYQRDKYDVVIQRKWLGKFGGSYSKGTLAEAYRIILTAPEYSFIEKWNMLFPKYSVPDDLMRYIYTANCGELFPSFEVPVIFLLGRHDYQVPSAPAAEYFEGLDAPYKRLIWFENSGHAPNFEEAEKFNSEITQIADKILEEYNAKL